VAELERVYILPPSVALQAAMDLPIGTAVRGVIAAVGLIRAVLDKRGRRSKTSVRFRRTLQPAVKDGRVAVATRSSCAMTAYR